MRAKPNMTTKNGGGKRQGRWWAANKISADVQEVIRARMNEPGLSRAALARELGVCASTLYRYIRLFGGDIDHNRSIKQDGVEDMIRKYYPHYTAREIEAMKPDGIAITKSRVLTWAERLGVKHTPETLQRIAAKRKRNMRAAHTKECLERRVKKRKRTLLMERFRQSSGMPQQTKLRLKRMPQRHYKAAYHLEHKFGYILTTNPYLIWYDDETRRTPREQMYVEKYGFRFEPAQDD